MTESDNAAGPGRTGAAMGGDAGGDPGKDSGNESGRSIVSPCVRLCVIHPETRLCTGCLRTIGEITDWTRYSDAERRAIMAALPEREARLRQRRGGRAGRLARRGAEAG